MACLLRDSEPMLSLVDSSCDSMDDLLAQQVGLRVIRVRVPYGRPDRIRACRELAETRGPSLRVEVSEDGLRARITGSALAAASAATYISSFRSSEVAVSERVAWRLAGRGGLAVRQLEHDSGGTWIRLAKQQNPAMLEIYGEDSAVSRAERLLENRHARRTIAVPRDAVSRIIGQGGVTIREIETVCGDVSLRVETPPEPEPCILEAIGDVVAVERAVAMVRDLMSSSVDFKFPSRLVGTVQHYQQELESSGVHIEISTTGEHTTARITGLPEAIEKACEYLQALVREHSYGSLEVPQNVVHLITGRGNAAIREVESATGVNVIVNRADKNCQVSVFGEQIAVDAALEAFHRKASPTKRRVLVPRDALAHVVGRKGIGFREIEAATGALLSVDMCKDCAVEAVGDEDAVRHAEALLLDRANHAKSLSLAPIQTDRDPQGPLGVPQRTECQATRQGVLVAQERPAAPMACTTHRSRSPVRRNPAQTGTANVDSVGTNLEGREKAAVPDWDGASLKAVAVVPHALAKVPDVVKPSQEKMASDLVRPGVPFPWTWTSTIRGGSQTPGKRPEKTQSVGADKGTPPQTNRELSNDRARMVHESMSQLLPWNLHRAATGESTPQHIGSRPGRSRLSLPSGMPGEHGRPKPAAVPRSLSADRSSVAPQQPVAKLGALRDGSARDVGDCVSRRTSVGSTFHHPTPKKPRTEEAPPSKRASSRETRSPPRGLSTSTDARQPPTFVAPVWPSAPKASLFREPVLPTPKQAQCEDRALTPHRSRSDGVCLPHASASLLQGREVPDSLVQAGTPSKPFAWTVRLELDSPPEASKVPGTPCGGEGGLGPPASWMAGTSKLNPQWPQPENKVKTVSQEPNNGSSVSVAQNPECLAVRDAGSAVASLVRRPLHDSTLGTSLPGSQSVGSCQRAPPSQGSALVSTSPAFGAVCANPFAIEAKATVFGAKVAQNPRRVPQREPVGIAQVKDSEVNQPVGVAVVEELAVNRTDRDFMNGFTAPTAEVTPAPNKPKLAAAEILQDIANSPPHGHATWRPSPPKFSADFAVDDLVKEVQRRMSSTRQQPLAPVGVPMPLSWSLHPPTGPAIATPSPHAVKAVPTRCIATEGHDDGQGETEVEAGPRKTRSVEETEDPAESATVPHCAPDRSVRVAAGPPAEAPCIETQFGRAPSLLEASDCTKPGNPQKLPELRKPQVKDSNRSRQTSEGDGALLETQWRVEASERPDEDPLSAKRRDHVPAKAAKAQPESARTLAQAMQPVMALLQNDQEDPLQRDVGGLSPPSSRRSTLFARRLSRAGRERSRSPRAPTLEEEKRLLTVQNTVRGDPVPAQVTSASESVALSRPTHVGDMPPSLPNDQPCTDRRLLTTPVQKRPVSSRPRLSPHFRQKRGSIKRSGPVGAPQMLPRISTRDSHVRAPSVKRLGKRCTPLKAKRRSVGRRRLARIVQNLAERSAEAISGWFPGASGDSSATVPCDSEARSKKHVWPYGGREPLAESSPPVGSSGQVLGAFGVPSLAQWAPPKATQACGPQGDLLETPAPCPRAADCMSPVRSPRSRNLF